MGRERESESSGGVRKSFGTSQRVFLVVFFVVVFSESQRKAHMAFTWKVTRGHLMGTLPEGARAPGLGGSCGQP